MSRSRSRSGSGIEPDAAAQERGREVTLAVAGQDDEGELPAAHPAAVDRNRCRRRSAVYADVAASGQPGQLGDLELAALEDVEQVVGQVDVALVDLVDRAARAGVGSAAARCRAARAAGTPVDRPDAVPPPRP